jgi:TatD DNase family protein
MALARPDRSSSSSPEPPLDLIDSHCHLTAEQFRGQIAAVLDRARAAGVRRCITVGTDLDDIRRAIEMARGAEGLWAVGGLHPHHSGQATDAMWADLDALLAGGGLVAVGETGLDFHYDFSDRASQSAAFARHIELAERHGLPIVIHSRESVDESLELLSRCMHRPAWGVFHCFTGTADEARRILEAGWHISLSGIVTFRNADALREAARIIPLDRLLLETDAPYNSPEPVRKMRVNEPAHLVHTCRFLAGLYGMRAEQLADQANRNAERLFGLNRQG